MRLFKQCVAPCMMVLAMFSSPTWAKPADIERIDQVYRDFVLVNDGDDAERKTLAALTNLVVDRAEQIGLSGGFGTYAGLDSNDFKASVRQVLQPKVAGAFKVRQGYDRQKALEQVLRAASSHALAEGLVARWMNFNAPGDYIKNKPKNRAPAAHMQIQVARSSSPIQVWPESVKLASELGGAGNGNGVFDAGEWVQVSMGLYNTTSTSFLSSSGWLASGSPNCVWVGSAVENQLPEMGPRDDELPEGKAPKLAPLSVWAYLSESCPDGTVAPVQVKILDTHRAPDQPIVVSLNMVVRNRIGGRASLLRFDTDTPGSSDGSRENIIMPEDRIELSHGFNTNADASGALMGWGLSGEMSKLVAQTDQRGQPPMDAVPGRAGQFSAGDDLDLESIEEESFMRQSREIGKKQSWAQSTDAIVWAATDVVVQYPSPGVVKPTPEKPWEYNPVPISQLIPMVKSHMDLEERSVPASSNEVAEAVAGYEMTLNESGLKRAYVCQLEGIPLAYCNDCVEEGIGLASCRKCMQSSLNVEQCKEQQGEAEKPEEQGDSVSYTYRFYHPLPIYWVKEPEKEEFVETKYEHCSNGIDDDDDGYIDCDDSDCAGTRACKVVEPEVCDNGEDDDEDGYTDCRDSDCDEFPACIPDGDRGYFAVGGEFSELTYFLARYATGKPGGLFRFMMSTSLTNDYDDAKTFAMLDASLSLGLAFQKTITQSGSSFFIEPEAYALVGGDYRSVEFPDGAATSKAMGMYEVGAALHLGAGRFGMFLDLRNRAIADMVQDGNVASTDGFRTSVGIEYRRR